MGGGEREREEVSKRIRKIRGSFKPHSAQQKIIREVIDTVE